MANAYEQDIAQLRGVLYAAMAARTSHAKLLQHRPLVDAIKRALALLDQPHPHDTPLRFALTALLASSRRNESGNWFVLDPGMYHWSMDQIQRLHGTPED